MATTELSLFSGEQRSSGVTDFDVNYDLHESIVLKSARSISTTGVKYPV